MRILLLAHSFNSLTQRIWVDLREQGHTVSLELDVNDAVTREAVALFSPDVLVAPFLKRMIPEDIWRRLPCLVVHPGPEGDRGPAALDWAILDAQTTWGVTVLQATADADAGPIAFSGRFPLRCARKSSLYRHEVTEMAATGVTAALAALAAGHPFRPQTSPDPALPADPRFRAAPPPRFRAAPPQSRRRIDWTTETTAAILRKIHSADGQPGVIDAWAGQSVRIFQAQAETRLTGVAGQMLARHAGAVCRATCDGALWIGQMCQVSAAPDTPALKLDAVRVLGTAAMALPDIASDWQEIRYQEAAEGVGFLHFPFANGAMDTNRCQRLEAALATVAARAPRILVLAGGPDFWSNGINLNTIEAADSPADESWANIVAMNRVVHALLTGFPQTLTIAALAGNAGAGGVFLALAADRVWGRQGVILNPHYKSMGNLYGSEYWTYVLPRRVGAERAAAVMAGRLPMGCREALTLGLLDAILPAESQAFAAAVASQAAGLAADPALPALLADKIRRQTADAGQKPLAAYAAEELAQMRLNFYGFDPSYHVARYHFVFKIPKSRTPSFLALHRQQPGATGEAGSAPSLAFESPFP